jgi:hypothetical protein
VIGEHLLSSVTRGGLDATLVDPAGQDSGVGQHRREVAGI